MQPTMQAEGICAPSWGNRIELLRSIARSSGSCASVLSLKGQESEQPGITPLLLDFDLLIFNRGFSKWVEVGSVELAL